MYLRRLGPALVMTLALVPYIVSAQAWSGPPGAPPSNNVSAPVNVGATSQTKNGVLGVNGLAVFGNSLLNGSNRYLNWGTTAGDTGYGIRDNAGTLEFKNSGGAWTSFAAGGSLPWLVSGNNIYNTNTGNVGINAPTPSYRLDVNPNAADAISGRIGPTVFGTMGHGATFAGMAHSAMATTLNYGFLQQSDGTTYLNTPTGRSIRFRENNTDRMVMSGANFGLGAITPTIRLAIGDSDTGFNWVSDGNFTLYTNNVERIRFDSAGNAGFGTTSPLQRIHASGNIRAEGFCINASCITSWGSGSIGGTGTPNYVPKFSAATTLANSQIFDNGTNVGIGTAGPGSKLHVSTSGITGDVAQFVSTGATDNPTFSFGNGSGSLRLFAGGGSGSYMTGVTQGDVGILFDSGDDFHIGQQSATPDITVLDNGNVGFRTTAPTQDLHIQDTASGAFIDIEAGPAFQSGIMIRGDREYRLVMKGNTTDDFAIRDTTANLDRIVITPTGSVGINTTAPTQSLHVTGAVLATSFLYSSDQRLKHDISILEGGLGKLLALEPVSFTWNDGTPQEGEHDIGFIAQQVEGIIPEAVDTDINGMKSVDYARLVPVLVKAIQEQQREIDTLQDELADLKGGL